MLIVQRTGKAIGAAAIVLAAMLAGPQASAGTWLTDAKSGCQIWDPNPQLEETANWTGSCSQGHAEGAGTLRWMRADTLVETDEGSWHDGRQSGKGSQIWPVGRYDGDVSDGLPNGHGVLVLRKLRYEGEFRDGKPNGQGSLTAGSETVSGEWKDGCLQGQRKAAIGVPLSACR